MKDDAQPKIWTIGHSTRDLDEFVGLLNAFSIKQLADVRSLPGSNKFPHFNQNALKEALNERGIAYFYFKKLGGRRKQSKHSKNTVWRNKSFRAYADYMESESFQNGIEQLEEIALKKTTAIMCSEAVWWSCHRSMIADQLKAQAWEVFHIMSKNKATEHPYTQPAKIVDGKLVYGKQE